MSSDPALSTNRDGVDFSYLTSIVSSESITIPSGKLERTEKSDETTSTADVVSNAGPGLDAGPNAGPDDLDASRLTDKYPQALTDFFPSRVPCIYKSGPVWESGPAGQSRVDA